MLDVEQLNQSYRGGGRILWNVELRIPEGGCVALMGRNGVGKTTLVKAILGLLPVDSGTISFLGADITHTPPERRAG